MQSKLPLVGTSVFTVMSSLASEYGAINLSQGFPDFKVSEELISGVERYMKMGMNQYAPSSGIEPLRKAIAEKNGSLYGCNIDHDKMVTITSGATEALFCAFSSVIEKDDEVIVLEPAYDSYIPVIKLNGGIPVSVPLKFPDFCIDWDLVKAKLNEKTKAIVINTPHNPTGSTLGSNDLLELEKVVLENDLYVISDEVYHHIIFDNKTHESVLKYEELSKRSFAVFSFGKTFHTTGWKVGYVIAPEKLTEEVRKIHQYLTFSVHTPTQFALADFLSDASNYNELGSFYQEKRDYFLDAIKDSKFKPIQSSGTYFQLLSYEGISDLSDVEMAEKMTIESGLASIPISGFYSSGKDDKILRFCFAKNNGTLEKAAEILCKI
ncbi:MAG: methionine aminotransferase [Bacteroidota bacterium]